MNKNIIAGLVLALTTLLPLSVPAGTIDVNGSYHGTIEGVAVGFFGHVGVGLVGANCNGSSVVVLLTTNPHYKDILSVLLSAQSANADLRLLWLSSQLQDFGSGNVYCVINYASLGNFPLW